MQANGGADVRVEILEHRNDPYLDVNVYLGGADSLHPSGRMLCKRDETKRVLYLQSILVDEDLRDRGLGSTAMRALIEFASARRFRAIEGWLSSRAAPFLAGLLRFYRKHGFEVRLRQSKDPDELGHVRLLLRHDREI